MWREVCVCVRACGREVRLGFACGCVLERVVCRVRFARVSCPWLRFGTMYPSPLCLVGWYRVVSLDVWFHVDTVHVIDTFTLSSQRVTLGVIHMIIQVLMIRKSQLLLYILTGTTRYEL